MHASDAHIIPVFRYRDAAAAIAWLDRAFGFSRHEVFTGDDGSIVHAELRLGSGAIGISSAGPVDHHKPWTEVRLGLYVCVHDIDALHARIAHADSAAVITPLAATSYGARECAVRDPGRHLWSVGTYMMGVAGEPSTLCACLHYDDGTAATAWLAHAFGFEKTLEIAGASGVIDHGELRLGHDVLMVSSAPQSSGLWGADVQCTCGQVDDPDAHCTRARAAGAQIVQPPRNTPYGAREYYARDLEGFLWGFSTYRPAR